MFNELIGGAFKDGMTSVISTGCSTNFEVEDVKSIDFER